MHTIPLLRRSFYSILAKQFSLDLRKGPWIAGGAARRMFEAEHGLPEDFDGDIDIFLPKVGRKEAAARIEDTIDKIARGVVVTTENNDYLETISATIGGKDLKFQIIKRGADTIEDLFSTFDFTVAQFATDGASICFYDSSRDDLLNKQLALVKPVQKRKPTAPFRVVKYCGYGFTPQPGVIQWAMNLDEAEINADLTIDEEVAGVYY